MIKINQLFESNFKQLLTIAEIGINHNGKLSNAISLIDKAKISGFKSVKFQIYDPDKLLNRNTPLANYQRQNKEKNMYEMLKKYAFSNDTFKIIKRYCDKKKIIFLATPFDYESALFLNTIGTEAFKISSADLNNFHLLTTIKRFKKPIILSTGMSENKSVQKTIKFLNYNKEKLALLHCISSYPTRLKDTQLSNIKELKKFNYYVGFSDHTIGKEASISALSLGARIFEKHITLNQNLNGPDHSSSMEVDKLKDFILTLEDLDKSLSNTKRTISKNEMSNKKLVTRSLYFADNLKKNHKISYKDILPLRPFKDGFEITSFKKLIGKKIKFNVKEGTLIKNNIL